MDVLYTYHAPNYPHRNSKRVVWHACEDGGMNVMSHGNSNRPVEYLLTAKEVEFVRTNLDMWERLRDLNFLSTIEYETGRYQTNAEPRAAKNLQLVIRVGVVRMYRNIPGGEPLQGSPGVIDAPIPTWLMVLQEYQKYTPDKPNLNRIQLLEHMD